MIHLLPFRTPPPPPSPLFPYTTLFRSLNPAINHSRIAPSSLLDTVIQASSDTPREPYASRKSCVRRARRHSQVRRSEEHTSELQSLTNLVCRLLLKKKKKTPKNTHTRT